MHKRVLAIKVELFEGEKATTLKEASLKNNVDLIFEPVNELELHHFMSTDFTSCMELYLKIRVSNNEDKRLKKLRKQMKKLKKYMRHAFIRGADVEVQLEDPQEDQTYDTIWEFGTETGWDILERTYTTGEHTP